MVDENVLLQRARELDEAALGTIYDTYYPPLYRYIYHHIRHMQTAEDVTAEVFVRLLKSLEKGRGPKQYLQAWLYRVAYNLIVDHSRRAKHRDHAPLEEELMARDERVAAQVQQRIIKQQAYAALDELTAKQREVIILKFLEELSNREVARILQTTEGSVKSLQHRGLAALRRQLEKVGAVVEGKK